MPELLLPGKSVDAKPRITVAPRVPDFPKEHTGNPFTSNGDVMAECAVAGCGYHIWGDRRIVKIKLDEHHKLYHPTETGVVLLNQPRQ